MEPLDIQYRLKKLGISQRALADELEVSQGVVSNTIRGRATSWTVANHIAGLLKMRPEELWPNRYCFKPRPRRGSAAAKPKTKTKKEEGAP